MHQQNMLCKVMVSLACFLGPLKNSAQVISWDKLTSPVVFAGDAKTAYRDPAAVYHDGAFHLYFTLVKIEPDGHPYLHTAWSKSRDLREWSAPKIFTPKDRSFNYSSPGNVIRYGNEWILCLQTYPRPSGENYGNAQSRLWIMRSKDLETWGAPELLKVKGPEVPTEKMGRMIDPYLIVDQHEPDKWWCFYKQNGASMSWSKNLKDWNYFSHVNAGENVCVIMDQGEYLMFHSPANGIGMKRSQDFNNWSDSGLLTLGQKDWPWAQGRLTAGFVLDLRQEPGIGKAIMFFHGSSYPEKDPRGGFDNFASLGMCWSADLKNWEWVGKSK